jgi:RNA polymerase sigma-70 factor, ECF subfamily
MTKTHHVSSIGKPDPALSELKLIRYSQQGDRDAFACLYAAYLDRIHRYIFFRVADPEVAEDITSLVFLKGWEKLHSYQPGKSPFAAWLYRIAHNAVIDHYRTRKTLISLEELHPAELSSPDEVDEKFELKIRSQKLYDALQELTGTQQEVLILKFYYGWTTMEISRRLEKQQGAVRALQMRGLKRLATILPSQESRYAMSDLA